MAEEMRLPDPVVLDFVLCDGVSRDLSTGKLSLLGLMGTLKADELPVRATFVAFVRLTNVRAIIPMHFRIVNADGNVILTSLETDLPKPADVLSDVVSLMHFPNVELESEGEYFVQLWRRERYIMEKKFEVRISE